jgi:type IV protein arginine methyltransferase
MAAQVSEEDALLAQRIISAAARHDIPVLQVLLKTGSANVQDPTETISTSPLHAAIAACSRQGQTQNGLSNDAVVETVELLLENGAIWNDLNKNDETPGCIALRLGQMRIYELMVQAGVRAELLFAKMAELGLDDEDDDDEVDEEKVELENGDMPSSKKLKVADDGDAADVSLPTTTTSAAAAVLDDVSLDNHAYLKSQLRYKPGILLDSSDNAVMMDWETQIMQRHAQTLILRAGLKVMNVGHGMGIVDTAIQTHSPAEHHIIEAHPQVLARLREQGWYDKTGVTIHEGRWQDVLPQLVSQGVLLDAIYYDTFAEPYSALKEFFGEYVVALLSPGGRFGWYNGLGADRQICYDVYTRVAEIDLNEAGFDTKWEDIEVPRGLKGSKEWEGTRRPYWTIDTYRLPVNTFAT